MVKDEPILGIIYNTLKDFSDDVFLQGCGNESGFHNIKNYPDIIKNKGPLGGIYSALLNAQYEKLLVIACDMPFVDRRILKELMKYRGYAVVVPRWSSDYYEPLCALYSKNLIPKIKVQIGNNNLKIIKLYSHVNVKTINIDELLEKGKIRKNCFKNINYPGDLENLGIAFSNFSSIHPLRV